MLLHTYGVSSTKDDKGIEYYHLFIIGWNYKKIFYTYDEDWDEDINKRIETTEEKFARDELIRMLNDEDEFLKIEAALNI